MSTIYKSTTVNPVKVDGISFYPVTWSSAEGAAKQAKRALADAYNLKPLKDVTHEKMELPTGKAGVLEFLNEFCCMQPAAPVEDGE